MPMRDQIQCEQGPAKMPRVFRASGGRGAPLPHSTVYFEYLLVASNLRLRSAQCVAAVFVRICNVCVCVCVFTDTHTHTHDVEATKLQSLGGFRKQQDARRDLPRCCVHRSSRRSGRPSVGALRSTCFSFPGRQQSRRCRRTAGLRCGWQL